jgi:hypothetical protein
MKNRNIKIEGFEEMIQDIGRLTNLQDRRYWPVHDAISEAVQQIETGGKGQPGAQRQHRFWTFAGQHWQPGGDHGGCDYRQGGQQSGQEPGWQAGGVCAAGGVGQQSAHASAAAID